MFDNDNAGGTKKPAPAWTAPWQAELAASENIAALAVLAGILALIFFLWLDPTRTWLYPEVIRIGILSATHEGGFFSFFPLFDWQLFDPNPQRIRVFNDLFETIDAWLRPYIAWVFAHPTLSITQLLFVTITPIFVLKALRAFNLGMFERLLLCALVFATPGFLSNLFAYIHPGKPLSFIVLSVTLWLLAENRDRELGLGALAGLAGLLVAGAFTDELLYWNFFFVVFARFIIRQKLSSTWPVAACSMIAIAIFLLLALVVLPPIYDVLGSDGPRRLAMVDHGGDEPTARRMIGYLVSPIFHGYSLALVGRSFADQFGLVVHYWPTIAPFLAILEAILISLAFTFKHRKSEAWQLAALGLFGFVSFGVFGGWLHWWQPHPEDFLDFVSLNYYYNSPVSIFFVFIAAAAFKGFRAAAAAWPPWTRWLPIAATVAIAISSILTFQSINMLFRFDTLANTDTRAIFAALNSRMDGKRPAITLVAGEKELFAKSLEQYNAVGKDLFGDGWPLSNLFRSPEYFEAAMQFYGPSYADVEARYGGGLCAVFVGAHCPVTFARVPGEIIQGDPAEQERR